jgi:general stress protein YciG
MALAQILEEAFARVSDHRREGNAQDRERFSEAATAGGDELGCYDARC